MPFFDTTISIAVRGKDRKEATSRLKVFLENTGWPCNVERVGHEPSKTEDWIDFIDSVAPFLVDKGLIIAHLRSRQSGV